MPIRHTLLPVGLSLVSELLDAFTHTIDPPTFYRHPLTQAESRSGSGIR